MIENSIHKRGFSILYIILAILLIVVGGFIYYAYRIDTLIMFRWADALNLHDFVDGLRNGMSLNLPHAFIRFNLPDGLWSISYLLIMLAIWHTLDKGNFFWFCFMPVVALLSEFLQLFSILPGYFDWLDVVCYTMPLIILITIKIIKLWTKRDFYQLER